MESYSVIDADGHIVERLDELREYLETPYDKRGGGISFSEPWDSTLRGSLPSNRSWCPRVPTAEDWLGMMDAHSMETSYLYSTSAGDVSRMHDTDYAVAFCRAYNNYVFEKFKKVSDRLRPVAIVPLQDPTEAAKELRRAVQDLGFRGASTKTSGLRLPLGHRAYDPFYEEAERLGCVFGIHGTRSGAQELAAGMFDTFNEVHTVAFPVGIFVQFTSIIFQGVAERFPGLRLAFLEIGSTWLPYWLDRMDEHWEKRGEVETPFLRRRPSECLRERPIYFSFEADETLLPETLKYLGEDHFVFASDIPHWDNEFPENIHKLNERQDLSAETKHKLLYENARVLYE